MPLPTRKFEITFSGMALRVEATSPEQAWKQVRKYLECYVVSHDVREMSMDVSAPAQGVAPLHAADRHCSDRHFLASRDARPNNGATIRSLNDTDPWEI